jgi:hypothetical protein
MALAKLVEPSELEMDFLHTCQPCSPKDRSKNEDH